MTTILGVFRVIASHDRRSFWICSWKSPVFSIFQKMFCGVKSMKCHETCAVLLEWCQDNRTFEHFVLATQTCGNDNTKRGCVAFSSTSILLVIVLVLVFALIFELLSVELGWPAATSAGCTRGGGGRSCPIRSSALSGRWFPGRQTL